jgi:hypothetical protein
VLRIPVIHGRGFTQAEAMQEAPVAIVSAAGARALWPGEDPLGKTLRVPVPPLGNKRVAETVRELRKLDDFGADALAVTVIGVVSDVISGFVYLGTDPAHVYLPTSATGSRAAALMTRGRAGELSAGTVRGILERRTADAQPYDVLALDEMVALQLFPLRAASWLGSLLSTIALVLSVSGLYGVLTYTFSQRTQEIGVRMALGASGGAIVRLVAEYSIRLASLGTILGGLVGFSVMKLLGTVVRLENLSVLDAGAFAASGLLIAAAVALASFGPARRAARVDPASMLRSD